MYRTFLIRPENSHWNWNRIVIKIESVTPCLHFPDTCRFETIFITHRLPVHTTPVLSAAQIGSIPLCSKK